MPRNDSIPRKENGLFYFNYGIQHGCTGEFRKRHGWLKPPKEKRNLGGMAVPLGELATGTRCKIIKWILAAIIGGNVLLCIVATQLMGGY